MLIINEIATVGRPSQTAANVGKIAGICFATTTPRVRVPPGPPSHKLILNNLNQIWLGEFKHGLQPWGLDSRAHSKRIEINVLARKTAVRAEPLEFVCPLLALLAQCHCRDQTSD